MAEDVLLYWLAGLLEGEGTFLPGPPSSPTVPVIRVVMTDLDVVEHVATMFSRTVQRNTPRDGHKPSFSYMPRGPALPVAKLAVPGLDDPAAIQWLAGLLEGEGSFASSDGYPVIKVSMCDRDVIVRAAELLGQAVWDVNDPRAPERGWSPTYATGLGGARAAELMRTLLPLMGTRRQAAIGLALESYAPVRLTSAPARCTVIACRRAHRSRGLCNTHYMMWSRDRANGREARITPLR